jgi:NitT/TauT family transport system substrate-binding protein
MKTKFLQKKIVIHCCFEESHMSRLHFILCALFIAILPVELTGLFSGILTPNFANASVVKVPLALNWKPEPQFGGFYAAHLIGADLKNEIQFELLPGGAGTPVVQMVAAGKMDFGIASADEVILARSHGADLVALFAAFQTNPQAIMTHEERGFKTLADLYSSKGTLAIQSGLPYALFLNKKYSGKTQVQIVPYLGGIQNFLADKTFSQQCFATSEPISAAKKGTKVKTFLVADEGYNPYTTVLIVRGDVLKKNVKLVKQVVAAVRDGWREYVDHPEKTNLLMKKLNTSVDAETFSSGALAQKPLIEMKGASLGLMTAARWQVLRQQLVDLKLVDKNVVKSDIQAYFRNF